MRKVKSTKNKSTELRLMEEFKRLGVTGWRRQAKLFGKPDFLFPKLRIAVFVKAYFLKQFADLFFELFIVFVKIAEQKALGHERQKYVFDRIR